MKKLIIAVYFFLLCVSPALAESITPQELVNKFNLRTIYSSLGQGLKSYCGSYPIDFMDISVLEFTEDSVTFDTSEEYFKIKILSPSQIEVTDIIKPPATYHTVKKYQIFYDKEHGDIRASEADIKISDPCEPYSERLRKGDYSEWYE